MRVHLAKRRLPPEFRRLCWASAADNIGDGALVAAVPLLAVKLTHDPFGVSLVTAATYLPWLLFSLPAGATADRRDRVTLMWSSQLVQAAIVAAAAALLAVGAMGVELLATMGFALGACEVVFANASQAIVPDIVPRELLRKANSRQYTIANVCQLFLGPPVGGVLFALAPALPFGLDSVSFAASAAVLAKLPRSRRRADPDPAQVAAGLEFVKCHRLLRTLALLVGVNTFCFQLGNVTLVLLATETMHLGARGYGILLAAAAAGSVSGGVVAARLAARYGALAVLLVSLGANVGIFLGIGASPDATVLGALLALNGYANTLWGVMSVSLRQEVVPSHLLGRVNSVYRMLASGLMPLGALAGGLVAHELGVRAAYPVAGALRAVAFVVALPALVPAVRAVAAPAAASE